MGAPMIELVSGMGIQTPSIWKDHLIDNRFDSNIPCFVAFIYYCRLTLRSSANDE